MLTDQIRLATLISLPYVKKQACRQWEKIGKVPLYAPPFYYYRYVVIQKDFDKAYKIVVKKTDKEYNFYKWSLKIKMLPHKNNNL